MPLGHTEAGLPGRIRRMDGGRAPEALRASSECAMTRTARRWLISAQAALQLDPSTIVSTNPGRNYEVVGEVGSHLPVISPSPCVRHVPPSPLGRSLVWQAASRLWGQWRPYSSSTARKLPSLSRGRWAILRRGPTVHQLDAQSHALESR